MVVFPWSMVEEEEQGAKNDEIEKGYLYDRMQKKKWKKWQQKRLIVICRGLPRQHLKAGKLRH